MNGHETHEQMWAGRSEATDSCPRNTGVDVHSALESVTILASRSESALSSGQRNTSLIENYRT